MSMKSTLMMVMGMAMMSGMGANPSTQRSYIELPEDKKVLPGKFTGVLPKGCKCETVAIGVKHNGYHLTQNVDIVFGSEKAKQKAIIKAKYAIREYLRKKPFDPQNRYWEFDQVEIYHL